MPPPPASSITIVTDQEVEDNPKMCKASKPHPKIRLPETFLHTGCWLKVEHFLKVPTTLGVGLGSSRHMLHLWYLGFQDLGLWPISTTPSQNEGKAQRKMLSSSAMTSSEKQECLSSALGKKNMPSGSHINLRYFHNR